jgi:hypothetical protein
MNARPSTRWSSFRLRSAVRRWLMVACSTRCSRLEKLTSISSSSMASARRLSPASTAAKIARTEPRYRLCKASTPPVRAASLGVPSRRARSSARDRRDAARACERRSSPGSSASKFGISRSRYSVTQKSSAATWSRASPYASSSVCDRSASRATCLVVEAPQTATLERANRTRQRPTNATLLAAFARACRRLSISPRRSTSARETETKRGATPERCGESGPARLG